MTESLTYHIYSYTFVSIYAPFPLYLFLQTYPKKRGYFMYVELHNLGDQDNNILTIRKKLLFSGKKKGAKSISMDEEIE